MENSMLNKITDYIKDNKITINGVYFKFNDFLPKAFNDAIVYYYQLFYKQSPKLDGFYVNFTEDDNVYFEFISENGTRIVVIKDYIQYKNLPPSRIIRESTFLEIFKFLDKRNYLETINALSFDSKQRFLKNINYEDSINISYENIANKIISYISYMQKEKDEIDKENMQRIFYIESDKSTNAPRSLNGSSGTHTERKNDEISIEERLEALDSYSPQEQFEAIASNTSSVYYVKVFKVKEKCKLVMEPKEGTKYTKVIHLDLAKLEGKEIKEVVIESLQLNRNEITKQKDITRHSHTTLDEYKKLLEYLINENDIGINRSTKNRIDEASNLKR